MENIVFLVTAPARCCMMHIKKENIFPDNFFTDQEKIKQLLCNVTKMMQFLQGVNTFYYFKT
jgi:hypothetical protein